LVGWVGAKPEQPFIPSGVAVCNFRVTAKRPAGRIESGERTFETDWTLMEARDWLAEQCGRFLHKGSRVRMVGSLHRHGLQGAVSMLRQEASYSAFHGSNPNTGPSWPNLMCPMAVRYRFSLFLQKHVMQ
jgi:single-stranded DNA-binding protein